MQNQDIRLVKLEESVLVTFVVTIPPELQRMVILDASFSIRVLENMDKGITHVTDFEDIKDWTNVTFNFDKGPSGRDPISSHFTEAAQWALKKIGQYPETDSILLLTFKDKPDSEDLEEGERRQYRRGETRMVEKFTRALLEAKVPNLRIKRMVDGREKEEDRIQFLTFGNETSLSDYKHIPHVLFLGVLHRSQTDLSGACLGAEGDLLHILTAEDVHGAKLSEQAHGIYQGASRGTSRTMVDGKALTQTVDLRHFDPWTLADHIRPVTKNATFNLPPAPESHHTVQSAVQVLEALAVYTGTSISSKSLRTLASLTHLSRGQFASVLFRALLMQSSPTLPSHLQQAARWSRVEGSRSLARLQ